MPKPYSTSDPKKAVRKTKEPTVHIRRKGFGVQYIVLEYKTGKEIDSFDKQHKLSCSGIEELLSKLPAGSYLVKEKNNRTGKILRRFLYQNKTLEKKF